jgi:hypothetical protein
MLTQTRQGVFETNSSSTHSITICMAEDYEKFKKGELLINYNTLITREEAIEKFKSNPRYVDEDFSTEDLVKEFLFEHDYLTMDEYYDRNEHETYTNHYTTPSGEKIVVFGYYGYGG